MSNDSGHLYRGYKQKISKVFFYGKKSIERLSINRRPMKGIYIWSVSCKNVFSGKTFHRWKSSEKSSLANVIVIWSSCTPKLIL